MDQPSAELLERLRGGDEDAAAALFDRYVQRLVALAASRLSARLARRLDPEDIVLSAWRSFFVGARDGRFSLEHSGDLWRLLASITLHKLYHQAAVHTADRRSLHKERPIDSGSVLERLARDPEPAPDEAAALADEIEQIMSALDPQRRRVLELRLQGFLIEEIAAQIGCSERTVRRILKGLKEQWTRRLLSRDANVAASCQLARQNPPASAGRQAGSLPPRRKVPSASAPLRYDDYLLQKHLGSGGMGKVYRARHRPSGTDVAVKFLKKAFLSRRDAVERFLDEARCVARLRHPGIVGVHGLGTTPVGGWFIVMDLIPGEDLARRVLRAPLSPADAGRLVAEAAEAIEYAHRQGVVHCDLKPANLLLSGDGRLLVTDFGLARPITPGPSLFLGPAGTAGFMAPEQIDPARGPIGPATDVYGLGAVLFALLTGRPPYQGRTPADILERVLSAGEPPDVRVERTDVPDNVAAICRRSLQRDPGARFRTAAELAAALHRSSHAHWQAVDPRPD